MCLALQVLALFSYWHFFFANKDISLKSFFTSESNSTPELGLTALQITCPTEEVAKKQIRTEE
jgi:hypothetical protein